MASDREDQAGPSPGRPVESEPSAGTGDASSGERGVRIRGEALAQISTELVQLHHRYYGKGPTKAKTYLVNDTVICILKGGFTTVERTMIDQGKADAVHQMRRGFQEVMEEQFTGAVDVAEVNGPDIKAENDFDKTTVKTVSRKASATGKTLRYTFPPHSYTMLKTRVG